MAVERPEIKHLWLIKLVATRLNKYERLGFIHFLLNITEDDFRNAAVLGQGTGEYLEVTNLRESACGKIADILNNSQATK